MKRIILASMAAVVIQPFFFFAWVFLPAALNSAPIALGDVIGMSAWVAAVAAVHLAILAIPAFFSLNHFQRLNWRNVLLLGLLVGALPFAILSWPIQLDSSGQFSGGSWHGSYREFVVNGVPTLYGWLQYVEGVAMFCIHGVLGAGAFYAVWRQNAL